MSLTCPTCNKNDNIVHLRTLTPVEVPPPPPCYPNCIIVGGQCGIVGYYPTQLPYPGVIRLEHYKCKNCETRLVVRVIVDKDEDGERKEICGVCTSVQSANFLNDLAVMNFGSGVKVDYVYHRRG